MDRPSPDEPPPLLGSWRNLYALVLGSLALWVIGGVVVSWWFAPGAP